MTDPAGTGAEPQVPHPDAAAAEQLGASGGGMRGAVSAALSGQDMSAGGIIASLGGVRGMLESFVPSFLFLVVYTLTRSVELSVIAPLAIGVAGVVGRLLQKQTVQPALVGLLGIAICAGFTLFTGQARDFYLPGILINSAYGLVLLISVLVGWPLIGFLVGAVRGDLTGWRQEPALRAAARTSTLVWVALFLARLAVQVPLYLASNEDLLGVARIVMGMPLFALVVLFTWLTLRRFAVSGGAQPGSVPASDEKRPGTPDARP